MEENERGGARWMLRRIYGLLVKCPKGRHKRSRKHVRQRGEEWVSKCMYCGTPMLRISKRNWVLDHRR